MAIIKQTKEEARLLPKCPQLLLQDNQLLCGPYCMLIMLQNTKLKPPRCSTGGSELGTL